MDEPLGSSLGAVDGLRRDEGLVLIKPEESGKVVKRDKFNNPPRIAPRSGSTRSFFLCLRS